jgi:DNA mismatch repair protein MutS2
MTAKGVALRRNRQGTGPGRNTRASPRTRPMDPCFASTSTCRQLDWPWICERLSEHVVTAEARDRCAQLAWAADRGEAERLLREVDEAMSLLASGMTFPLGAVPDIRGHLLRLRKGAVLEAPEILDMLDVLESARTLRRFLLVHKDSIPTLAAHTDGTSDLGHLIATLRSCFAPDGDLSDTASPLLGELREHAKRLHTQILKKMSSYLSSEAFRDLLQDTYYTVKEDRYVLPIKAHERAAVDGIVLGSSASGATLFVEPTEVVALNNAHKLALLEIQNEVQRIYKELSDQLRRSESAIEASVRLLVSVDLVHAKARFSLRLHAAVPVFTSEPRVRLIQARHPILVLLAPEVVPNDIQIGPGFNTLVLTGPNTGGKTVLLKTLGLCALMARAGLPIPAERGSTLPFFDRVHADIGDDQSIEARQSTFSSHMARIKDMLESLRGSTLVLLDEVVIGTDPEEGAALAQAILEYLAARGALTVATTHYLPLKTLATLNPSFQNASMGFDPDTLTPSYRLMMGVPGNSNALEIARRLGIDDDIIAKASSLLGSPRAELDELLSRVNQIRQELEADRAALARLIKENNALGETLRAKWSEVASRESALKTSYRKRLEAEFSKARQELEQWRRRARAAASSKEAQQLQEDLSRLARSVLDGQGVFAEQDARDDRGRPVDWSRVRVGDRVYLRPYKTEARVLAMPDAKGKVLVEAGEVRLRVPQADICAPAATQVTVGAAGARKKGPSYTLTEEPLLADAARTTEACDLRGLDVEEALAELGKALDRAFRTGAPRLFLIHGLGTGALRRAVREYLQASPYSLSFRPGRRGEGGDGVTVVEFETSAL